MIVEGVSFILSKIILTSSEIAFNKNPSFHSKNSFVSSIFSFGFCDPINSDNSILFVQIQ